MAPGMNNPLYTTELLRLAASLQEAHELEREDGFSDLRSPTCGSRIRLAVQLDCERRVEALSMTVQACAFGQASAALVEQHGRGQTREGVFQAIVRVNGWLSGGNAADSPWPGFELLAAARSRAGRHGAILLPFRALLAAIESVP